MRVDRLRPSPPPTPSVSKTPSPRVAPRSNSVQHGASGVGRTGNKVIDGPPPPGLGRGQERRALCRGTGSILPRRGRAGLGGSTQRSHAGRRREFRAGRSGRWSAANRRSAAVAGERGTASGRPRPVSSAASHAAGSLGTASRRRSRRTAAGSPGSAPRDRCRPRSPAPCRSPPARRAGPRARAGRRRRARSARGRRVGGADGDDGVGRAHRGDGGGVAPGGEQVAHDLLVRLEVEAGVHDRVVRPPGALLRTPWSRGPRRAPATGRGDRCR